MTEPSPAESASSIVELTVRLAHLRRAKKDIEAEEEGVRRRILSHFESSGERQVFTAGGQVAATLRESVRTNINRAKLEAVYPEVYADVITVNRVRQIWLP